MVGSGSRGRGGEVVVGSDVDKVVDDLEEHGELSSGVVIPGTACRDPAAWRRRCLCCGIGL
jgi:hypothetical protein